MSDEGLRARAQKFMLERDSTTIHWTRNNVAQELADFAQQIREECAQIAESFNTHSAHEIAAAIRNLAEKDPT